MAAYRRARIDTGASAFATTLLEVVEQKFNRHLYDRRVWGYGKVLFPE